MCSPSAAMLKEQGKPFILSTHIGFVAVGSLLRFPRSFHHFKSHTSNLTTSLTHLCCSRSLRLVLSLHSGGLMGASIAVAALTVLLAALLAQMYRNSLDGLEVKQVGVR